MPNPFGGPSWTMPGTSDALLKLHIRQFINRANTSPRTMVTWLNGVQAIAETSRLGIPAFFVTNPRNHLGGAVVVGIEEAGGSFSQWPGTLGLAATRDVALVEEFSRISAEEHVAVGIRGAYHPQIDLATEPRWARISGTFGEDADLTSDIARAMVRGFQGPTLGPKSVALIFKHFPSGGPAIAGPGLALRVRQVLGVSRQEPRVPRQAVQGGHRRRGGGDHAVLLDPEGHHDRPGRHVVQQGDRHRPAAQPPRLHGRGELGLGHHDEHGVGRRVAHRRAALQEGHRRGRGHLQQRRDAGVRGQSREEGRADGGARGRVGAAHPARAHRTRHLRESVRRCRTRPSASSATPSSRRRASSRSASRSCCCPTARARCR